MIENATKTAAVETLQDDVKALQDNIRRLEIQLAALSHVNTGKILNEVEAGDPPHPAVGKCQQCKSCKNARMPHKSNPHYTCGLRHKAIEPTWTCGLYHDKNRQNISEPASCRQN